MLDWFQGKEDAESFFLRRAAASPEADPRIHVAAALATVEVFLNDPGSDQDFDVTAAIALTEIVSRCARSGMRVQGADPEEFLASAVFLLIACSVISRLTQSDTKIVSSRAVQQFMPSEFHSRDPDFATKLHGAFCKKDYDVYSAVTVKMEDWMRMPSPKGFMELAEAFSDISKAISSGAAQQ